MAIVGDDLYIIGGITSCRSSIKSLLLFMIIYTNNRTVCSKLVSHLHERVVLAEAVKNNASKEGFVALAQYRILDVIHFHVIP